ncbi:MAG: hypothetical protein ACF8XB_04860, partial [Planctomycetota bacterium JB042]
AARTEEETASSDREEAARAVLESFDAAWAAGDLDAMTSPLSPFFGCELYGDVNASQLREAFGLLLEDLTGTRSATHVLSVRAEGEYVQAFTCRLFSPLDRPSRTVEELCHVYYLKGAADDLSIVGLEEYDHDGYSCLRPDRFVQPRLAFSFDLPRGAFVVPAPDTGAALEEVVLRSGGLKSEIRLLLLRTDEPFALEEAFETDLKEWTREHRPAKVERRRRTEVAGRPAIRASLRFSDASCRLAGVGRDVEPKSARRIYVALDDTHLLAITMQAPRKDEAAADAALESVLASFRLDLDEGRTYGETVERRNGWGRREDGFFACSDSGLIVEAPQGFELDLIRTGPFVSLRASPASGGVSFRIDCVPLLDPDVPLEELIDLDAATREATQHARLPRQVGDRSAVEVDRTFRAGSPRARMEKIVYIRNGRHVVTIRVCGSREDVEAAEPALEELLSGISILGR